MALTRGTGPFGERAAGTFNFDRTGPRHVLYVEPNPRWIRGEFDGRIVVSTRRSLLVHETGHLPKWYVPLADVDAELLEPSDRSTHCPFKGDARYWSLRSGERVVPDAAWNYPDPIDGAPDLSTYVSFWWHAMDAWYEEAERVDVHPRDPYHRVDALHSSARVVVALDGEVLAETDRPVVVFETGLPPRYYIPEADVRSEILAASEHTTRCPYKGLASYRSAKGVDGGEDVAWLYADPLPEVAKIAGHVAFFNERVDITVDGERLERPVTPFS